MSDNNTNNFDLFLKGLSFAQSMNKPQPNPGSPQPANWQMMAPPAQQPQTMGVMHPGQMQQMQPYPSTQQPMGFRPNRDRRNVTCYRCQKTGHYASECKDGGTAGNNGSLSSKVDALAESNAKLTELLTQQMQGVGPQQMLPPQLALPAPTTVAALQPMQPLPPPSNLVAEHCILKTKMADFETQLEQSNLALQKLLSEGAAEYDDSDIQHKVFTLSREVATMHKGFTALKKMTTEGSKKADTALTQSCKAIDDMDALKDKVSTSNWDKHIYKAEQKKMKDEMALLRDMLQRIVKGGTKRGISAALEKEAEAMANAAATADMEINAGDHEEEVEEDSEDDGAGVNPPSRPKRTASADKRKKAKPTAGEE